MAVSHAPRRSPTCRFLPIAQSATNWPHTKSAERIEKRPSVKDLLLVGWKTGCSPRQPTCTVVCQKGNRLYQSYTVIPAHAHTLGKAERHFMNCQPTCHINKLPDNSQCGRKGFFGGRNVMVGPDNGLMVITRWPWKINNPVKAHTLSIVHYLPRKIQAYKPVRAGRVLIAWSSPFCWISGIWTHRSRFLPIGLSSLGGFGRWGNSNDGSV